MGAFFAWLQIINPNVFFVQFSTEFDSLIGAEWHSRYWCVFANLQIVQFPWLKSCAKIDNISRIIRIYPPST